MINCHHSSDPSFPVNEIISINWKSIIRNALERNNNFLTILWFFEFYPDILFSLYIVAVDYQRKDDPQDGSREDLKGGMPYQFF